MCSPIIQLNEKRASWISHLRTYFLLILLHGINGQVEKNALKISKESQGNIFARGTIKMYLPWNYVVLKLPRKIQKCVIKAIKPLE